VTDQLLEDQIAYYRSRASEYDWFLRQGRYDRGPQHRQEWFAEVDKIRSELLPQIPHESVLEFACGTGLWTQLLTEHASRVVAVDASSEVIAQSTSRFSAPNNEGGLLLLGRVQAPFPGFRHLCLGCVGHVD
jgi:demethylmenaquinone methyltransferase/2-methoxy-6-polyprenyl-1,4-benzoquinol methylase